MKIGILLVAFVALSSAVQAQVAMADGRPEFPVVDRGHWAYAAVKKAIRWILPQEEKGWMLPNSSRAATRYEFAVAIARMEDKLSTLNGQITPYNLNSARDIVAGLQREFQVETEHLRMGDPFSEMPRRFNPPLIPPLRLVISPSDNLQERIEIELANADVDRSNWSYVCAGRVASALKLPRIPSLNGFRPNLMTRYEFALFVARINGFSPINEYSLDNLPLEAKEKDCLWALYREYQHEIDLLSGGEMPRRQPDGTFQRVVPPPRLTITPSVLLPTPVTEFLKNLPPAPKP